MSLYQTKKASYRKKDYKWKETIFDEELTNYLGVKCNRKKQTDKKSLIECFLVHKKDENKNIFLGLFDYFWKKNLKSKEKYFAEKIWVDIIENKIKKNNWI